MDFLNMLNPVARWLHILAGIMWIGLLYFFNFINGHVAATMDGDTKKKVVPELMPRALFWFRWGAAWTWFSGMVLLYIIFWNGSLGMGESEGTVMVDAGSEVTMWTHIMLLVTFVAVFAYYIAPDSSPFANEMHLELSTLYPGTEVVFIKEKVVEQQKQSNGFINRLIYGKNQAYVFLPVHSFKVEDSLIIYNPYGSSYYKELPISSQRNFKI